MLELYQKNKIRQCLRLKIKQIKTSTLAGCLFLSVHNIIAWSYLRLEMKTPNKQLKPSSKNISHYTVHNIY